MSAHVGSRHLANRAEMAALSHFLPFDADFGGRSIACLAKINERLKFGMPGRGLNGNLWVLPDAGREDGYSRRPAEQRAVSLSPRADVNESLCHR